MMKPIRIHREKLKWKYSYRNPGVSITKYYNPSGNEYWLWNSEAYGWGLVRAYKEYCMVGFPTYDDAIQYILKRHASGAKGIKVKRALEETNKELDELISQGQLKP